MHSTLGVLFNTCVCVCKNPGYDAILGGARVSRLSYEQFLHKTKEKMRPRGILHGTVLASPLVLLAAAAALPIRVSLAFSPPAPSGPPPGLAMAPRYDSRTGRYSPSRPEEEASAGYGPLGSLLRQGPVPFVRRLVKPEKYDQGVLKMMADDPSGVGRSRDTAQGNMDAFLCNPNDYALQKLEEKAGAPEFDYGQANMELGQLALTAAWSGVLLALVSRIVYVSVSGCDEFCQTFHW